MTGRPPGGLQPCGPVPYLEFSFGVHSIDMVEVPRCKKGDDAAATTSQRSTSAAQHQHSAAPAQRSTVHHHEHILHMSKLIFD